MASTFYIVEWEYIYDHTNIESQLFCLEEYENDKETAMRRAEHILRREISHIGYSVKPIRLLQVVQQKEKEHKTRKSVRLTRAFVLEEIKRYTPEEIDHLKARKKRINKKYQI